MRTWTAGRPATTASICDSGIKLKAVESASAFLRQAGRINTISPVVGRFAIYFRLFGKRYAPVSAFHPWRCRCYTNGARISGRLDSDQRRARRTRQIGFVLVRAAKHALTTTSRARRRAATRCAALSDHGIDVLVWLPSSLHAGAMPPTSTT